MAIRRDVTPDDNLFTGEVKTLIFRIYQADGVTPLNVTFPLSWMVKRDKKAPDSAAVLTKTSAGTITVTGVFNADPTVNTQQVNVPLTDADSNAISSTVTYYHELKRTDLETILTWGSFAVRQAVHR